MANLTDREKLIASTFSIVDIWVSHLEENGMDASEAIALREKSLSEGKTEEEFMAWCESNKMPQEEPIPFGYSTMEEYEADEWKRNRIIEYNNLNQLEMQFDDDANSTTTWKDAIAAIKAKWPKDNSGPV